MLEAIQIKDKLKKYERIDQVKQETLENFAEVYAEKENVEELSH